MTSRLINVALAVSLAGGLAMASGTTSLADDSSVVGSVRVDATIQHLGVLWWIEGDDDRDSSFALEYRQSGELTWRQAAPAMRAYPDIRVQDAPLDLNYWAASAMFLVPGQVYELRLTLTDPDGGSATRVVTGTTRLLPRPAEGGRLLWVVPGDGGGSGTAADPFRGLQTAVDAVIAGDTIRVAAGRYSPFQLLASGVAGEPIAIVGPVEGGAIIDGGGTERGVVTLGEWNVHIAHVILQGLTISNGRWGVDLQHSHDILIRRCSILDVDYGVINRRADGLEGNQIICDCDIQGRTLWPGSGIPSERGIDLRGYGNIVCHNSVRGFGDGISLQPFTGPSYGNDVYGNDVTHCVDDGIEVDYNQANVRVWRNRVANARMGVSLQPIRGGPAYIVRNELVNTESEPIKMHNYTTGFYIVNNTSIKHGNGYGDAGAMWRNAVLRNNLFLGSRYAFEFTTVADEGWRDLDYNAWGTSRAIGGQDAPYFKWDNVRYQRLDELPAGVEDHGIEVNWSDLREATLGADWDVAVDPDQLDLSLISGSSAIDGGIDLPNLDAGFLVYGPPDMGAFESRVPLPHYGPRYAPGSVPRDFVPLVCSTRSDP